MSSRQLKELTKSNILKIKNRKIVLIIYFCILALLILSSYIAVGFGAVASPSQVNTQEITVGVASNSQAQTILQSNINSSNRQLQNLEIRTYKNKESLESAVEENRLHSAVITNSDSTIQVVTYRDGLVGNIIKSKVIFALRLNAVENSDHLSSAEKNFISQILSNNGSTSLLLNVIILPVLVLLYPLLSGLFVIDTVFQYKRFGLLEKYRLTKIAPKEILASIVIPGISFGLLSYFSGLFILYFTGSGIKSPVSVTVLFVSVNCIATSIAIGVVSRLSLNRIHSHLVFSGCYVSYILVPNPLYSWNSAIEQIGYHQIYTYSNTFVLSEFTFLFISILTLISVLHFTSIKNI